MKNNKITLHDIFEIVNRLEDKMDKRLCSVENKVDTLESFKDNLLGKITFMTGIISLIFTCIWEYFREKIK
jgi:hypothetical protein